MLFSRKRKLPFCTAPFTSFVIDPDKGVRPCCMFEGHLGNLKQDSLATVLEGPDWKRTEAEIERGDIPAGCVKCVDRERHTGWSVRREFNEGEAARDGSWSKGLTEIEINSSSICNLSCTHCNTEFSSRWVKQLEELEQRGVPHHRGLVWEIHKPDPEAMRKHLEGLDLRHLHIARFKGGEPMLNEDVPAVLRYLDEIGILGKVAVCLISNGSIINEEVLALLRKAREVWMCISVDGMDGVQQYIRRGPSEIHRIDKFVATLAEIPRVGFSMSCSVMAYNVFSLDRIADWWNALSQRYPGRFPRHRFSLHVVEPPFLSVSVLQDATRSALIEKYSRLDNADYESVLQTLHQPFLGAQLHDDFVAYTRAMDELYGPNVEDVIPELAHELVYLDPARAEAAAPPG